MAVQAFDMVICVDWCSAGCQRSSANTRSDSEENYCQEQKEVDSDRFKTWS